MTLTPPTPAPRTALDWARVYSGLGWSVVPVRRGEKMPAEQWGRYQSLPADENQILAWFADRPEFGVGLVQGSRAGTIVLDFDADSLGLETLADLERKGLPSSVRAFTPGGGCHVILCHPGKHVPTRKRILPGMDVRGDGGFIVACPSMHANGREYAWDVDCHPEEVPVADCPDWLTDLICGDAPAQSGASADIVRVAAPGPLGTPLERIADGREQYMRDTILAVCVGLHGRLGRIPTPEELFGEAWPQYAAKADLSRPGRGEGEFRAKVAYTLHRYESGRIKAKPRHEAPDFGAETIDPETGEILLLRDKVTAADTFRTYAISEIIDMPPPEWLLDGILTIDGLAALYGPPASLKSFVAISAGLAISYGLPWMGRPTKKTGVLYVASEGVRGLGRRIRAWQRQNKMDRVEAPFRLLAATVNLTDTAQATKLIRTAIAASEEDGCSIGLVIIDTVARAMAGADENSAQDMGRFISGCDAIREGVKCALLGIHHAGKDETKGARGSSAFLGALDTLVRVKREEDKQNLTLTIEKQKDDDEGDPIHLQAIKVEIGQGIVPETSLVVIPREPPPRGRPKKTNEPDADEMLMRVILAMGENKEVPFRAVADALGVTSGTGRQALSDMIPMSRACAVTVRRGDCRTNLWRTIKGDRKNSPQMLHMENDDDC